MSESDKRDSDDVASAVEAGREHFMNTLGNVPEPIRAMMEHAPDVFAGYLRMREGIYRDRGEGHLDLKTKELLYVVLDVVTGNEAGAKNHLQAGMKAGLTVGEVADACMQVMHVCGITTWGTTGYKVVDHAAELARGGKGKG